MTPEEILQSAIEQAIANGFTLFGFANWKWNVNPGEYSYQTWVWVSDGRPGVYPGKFSLNDILFSKEFAQALWGKERHHTITERTFDDKAYKEGKGSITRPVEDWEYHLMNMVWADNPLHYLAQFLDTK